MLTLTAEDQLQALRLAAAGLAYNDIGKLLGLAPKETVRELILQGYQELLSKSREHVREAKLGWVVYGIGQRLKNENVLSEAPPNSHPHYISTGNQAKKALAGIGKIRINELARECEVKAHEIVNLLPELGIKEKKTHSSPIDQSVADAVRSRLGRPRKNLKMKVDDNYLALALMDGRLRVVAITPDGEFQFLDSSARVFDLLYTYTSETKALDLAIQELEDLLNSRLSNESDFQHFFERNPDFIKTADHTAVRSDIYLTRDNHPTLKPDFFLKPINPAKSWDLLELKLPTAPAYVTKTNRERLSQAVMEARAQLLTYQGYFDEAENRQHIETKYGVFAYRPRLFVVIGRKGNVSPIITAKADDQMADLCLRTYDDIVLRMKCKLNELRDGHVR